MSGTGGEALRPLLDKLGAVLDSVPEAIVWTDLRGVIQGCNAGFDMLLGRERERSIGSPLIKVLPLSLGERALTEKDHPVAMAVGGRPGSGYFDFKPGDRELALEVISSPVPGDAPSFVFTLRDVTEKRRSEDAFLASSRSLEKAYDRLNLDYTLSRQALALEDDREFWPLLAKRLGQFFGCDRVSIFQRDDKGRLHSRYAQGLEESVVLEPGTGVAGHVADTGLHYLSNDPYNDPKFHSATDASTGYETFNLLGYPLSYQSRIVGVVELMNKPGGFQADDLDGMEYFGQQIAMFFVKFRIEERQEQMVGEMIQMEKMAAVGRLASGVAHEINNPLSAILGFTQLLLRTHSEPELKGDLEKIDSEAKRIRTIVRDLLGFSRVSRNAASSLLLPQVVADTLPLIQHELRDRKAEIVTDFEADPPLVLGDHNQLKQVFINLMINALQAMDREKAARIILRAGSDRQAGWAWVEVEDNGPGIAPEIQGKIFEPFFTTKDAGKGTGLGLYVVMGIVTRHKGRIEVRSKPGEGAVFRVSLPVSGA